uniref:HTH CENPB-type domain-containing protein n=1 Tax=Steinernema glaseri TaxID=37863 RepID=A0A1I8ARU8_9BILA
MTGVKLYNNNCEEAGSATSSNGVARVVVEIPRISMDLGEDSDNPSSSFRRSTRSAARKATQNIRASVSKKAIVEPEVIIEDSDQDNAVDPLAQPIPPFKRKRGRPRKYPREEDVEEPKKAKMVALPPPPSMRNETRTPTIYRVKDGKLISSAGSSRSPVFVMSCGTLKPLDPVQLASTSEPEPCSSQNHQDLGLYEKIEVHIRKAGISSSYCLKKLDDDDVVVRVMEILRPRSGLHSSYDVVTALVRLGVLCVDDPILPSRTSVQDENALLKNLLEQFQEGPSSIPDSSSDDIVVLDGPELPPPPSAAADSSTFNSVLKSIPAKRGKCTFGTLNEAVWKFFVGCAEANVTLNGRILRQRAFSIAKRMNLHSFRASEGWLSAFKYRHKISFASMTGRPYDYNNGFEGDNESADNNHPRPYTEPTVREVVTSASNLNMSAKSFLRNQTDNNNLPAESNGEAVSTISAEQFVRQIAAEKAGSCSISPPPNRQNGSTSSSDDIQEIPMDQPPHLNNVGMSVAPEPTDSDAVLRSLVKSCVFTVPDEAVQAAVGTLRSHILLTGNMSLLGPLSHIQETLAKSTPISQPSTNSMPTIASALAEQMPSLPQLPFNPARVIVRKTRTPIKYASGRNPNIKLFPKRRYEPTFPDSTD